MRAWRRHAQWRPSWLPYLTEMLITGITQSNLILSCIYWHVQSLFKQQNAKTAALPNCRCTCNQLRTVMVGYYGNCDYHWMSLKLNRTFAYVTYKVTLIPKSSAYSLTQCLIRACRHYLILTTDRCSVAWFLSIKKKATHEHYAMGYLA